nr:hypothetical protein CFP56_38910 [Quercus suber]
MRASVLLRSFLSLLLFEDLVASAYSSANSTRIINVDNDPQSVLDATAWALIYTYPLAVFASWAGGVLKHVDVNQIYHQRTLATPADPGVIKPNEDTLYSRVVLDLSSHDVVLTVPEINDGRYWNYPVLDAYGNVIAEIGAVNGNKAGKYLIRRSDDTFTAPGYVSHNTTSPQTNGTYRGAINVPTTYGTMLIRLLVAHNTTQDLNILHTYQNASSLIQIKRQQSVGEHSYAPSLLSTAFSYNTLLGIATPAKQFEFAARVIPYNQPQNYSERYRVSSILTRAGLYNGHFHPVSGINLTEAAAVANASITADVQAPAHLRPQSNDWELSTVSYQGNFGTHYASAAYVALAGYQQQTVKQVLYPGYRSLGFTNLFTLAPNSSYLFTFSGKPRVKSSGFWSLSLYGPDQYLIPNPLNRFEVGDRTYDLVYEAGGHVYGPQANQSRDGPFQILIQPVDLAPPANWTSNWLPTETSFSLIRKSFDERGTTCR